MLFGLVQGCLSEPELAGPRQLFAVEVLVPPRSSAHLQ